MLKNNFQKGSASFKTIAGIAVIAVAVAIVSAYATIKMMTPNALVAPVSTTDVTSKSTPAPSLTPTRTMIPDAVEDWKAYNNSKDGYEIKYPSDWIILSDWKSITTDKYMGINFCGPEYRSTAECSTGGKGNNPVITLRNDMPDINKAGYCSKNEASIFCDKSLILSQREAEIAGKTGIITEFKDMNDGSIRADWKKNSTDEKVYELTVVGLKKYANYREIFDKMLSTFKFTNKSISSDDQADAKLFCQSLVAPGYKLGTFGYFSNSSNEKFADCGIGSADSGSPGGIHIVTK